MESEKLRGSSLSEFRFRKVLFTLRLVGISLNLPSVSRVRSVYNGIIVVCFYMMYSACLMDLVLSKSNLEDKMKTFRGLIGMQFVVFIHLFFRYLQLHCPTLYFLNYKSAVLCSNMFKLNINYNVLVKKLNSISVCIIAKKFEPYEVTSLKIINCVF
jgi:hypothetical protein